MARMQIPTETSAWLLQARDFLYEARRLKPGPERNDLRQTAKVLREIAQARGEHPAGIGGREPDRAENPLFDGFSGNAAAASRDAGGRAVARKRAHMASPDLIPGTRRSSDRAAARDRAGCIANISSTSRCMTLWHSHAAAASRAGSISIRPRRSDLIAPLARSLRIRSVTVVRRTPRICESACWVSGSTSWSTRSRSWSNQRAMRASTG